MNTDFRISVTFPAHPKALKLMRRLGDRAFYCLVRLWAFTASNKSKGVLERMDDEDVELAADWQGDPGTFVEALLDLSLLDRDEQGRLCIHDWQEHNAFAAHASERSEKAKKAAEARWQKRLGDDGNAQKCSEQCSSNAGSIAGGNAQAMQTDATSYAPSPTPTPTPTPTPSPNPKPIPNTEEEAERCEAHPSAPDTEPEPPVFEVPLSRKGQTFAVTESMIWDWQQDFPAVNVRAELTKLVRWNKDNPRRRKTRNGIRRHISSWLGRAQDRAASQPNGNGQQTTSGGWPLGDDGMPMTWDQIRNKRNQEALQRAGEDIMNGGGLI